MLALVQVGELAQVQVSEPHEVDVEYPGHRTGMAAHSNQKCPQVVAGKVADENREVERPLEREPVHWVQMVKAPLFP